ncbi:hypothetical protein CK203_027200 [Vitis vinifera]|uniref:VQ domain-containing protein n=1 Tax=Vitis vinifera TaxID=29760 RepID=A0A438I657_VITVI|nr:hypothetical protein CK203_027200 [Vitis vinifera]
MDKALSVDQRKASGKAKAKKTTTKPFKVVYIGNPRMVKVKESEFRALVQELTGQDADISDPTVFEEIHDVGGNQKVPDVANNENELELDVPPVDRGDEPPQMSDIPMEQLDDVFTPQLLENFTGLLQSTLWYESPHVNPKELVQSAERTLAGTYSSAYLKIDECKFEGSILLQLERLKIHGELGMNTKSSYQAAGLCQTSCRVRESVLNWPPADT